MQVFRAKKTEKNVFFYKKEKFYGLEGVVMHEKTRKRSLSPRPPPKGGSCHADGVGDGLLMEDGRWKMEDGRWKTSRWVAVRTYNRRTEVRRL